MEIKCYQENECYEFMIVNFVDHNIIDIKINYFIEFHMENHIDTY